MSLKKQPSMADYAGADQAKDAAMERVRHMQDAYFLGRRKPLCEGGNVWFRGECGECDLKAAEIFNGKAQP